MWFCGQFQDELMDCTLAELILCYCCKLNNMIYGIKFVNICMSDILACVECLLCHCSCDAPNPGCPLIGCQPAEIYMCHVMRPIYVQKWPLGPTHHTHKMYILYKNYLITIYINCN